jgi:hypothetical protein
MDGIVPSGTGHQTDNQRRCVPRGSWLRSGRRPRPRPSPARPCQPSARRGRKKKSKLKTHPAISQAGPAGQPHGRTHGVAGRAMCVCAGARGVGRAACRAALRCRAAALAPLRRPRPGPQGVIRRRAAAFVGS